MGLALSCRWGPCTVHAVPGPLQALWELRMRVMFLPGPVGLREGAGRGMTQPGGLGESGRRGQRRGEQRLEASLALESDVSGSGGQGKGRRQLVEMRGLGLRKTA